MTGNDRLNRRGFLLASGAATLAATLLPQRRAFAAESFRVGSICPITGAGSPYGAGMQKAIQFAIDEVNGAGGAGGRMLELFAEDDQTSPEQGVLAAKKLIEVNKVQAILGTWASGVTLAVLPLTNAANILEMNTSGAPAISEQNTKGLAFRYQATNDQFGQSFAKICEKRGFKRPATMAFNNASGIGNAEGFRKAWEKMGGKVYASVVYEPKQASYRAEVEKVLAAEPDVIVTGSYVPDATIILREWWQTGAKNKWIFPGWAANPELIKAVGAEVCEGVISVDTVPNEDSSAFKRFSEAYQKATGNPGASNVYAAMSYDMVIALALAMEAAGPNADPPAIAAKMRVVSNPPGKKVFSFEDGKAALKAGEKIDYDGASSRLDFDERGDISPTFGVYVIESGQLVRRDVVTL